MLQWIHWSFRAVSLRLWLFVVILSVCSYFIWILKAKNVEFFMLENSHTMEMSFFFFWDLDVFMNLSRRRIQDLSEGGADPKGGTIMQPIFPENCMKMKKIGPREACKICLCRSATWSKEGNTTVKQKISNNAIKAFFHWSFCTNAKQMNKLILFPSRPCVTQQGSASVLTTKKGTNMFDLRQKQWNN